MKIVVLKGVSKMTPDIHRAIQAEASDWDVIRDADIVVGIHGEEAVVLKHPEESNPVPIPTVDLRERPAVYREDGEHLLVKVGREPRMGDVRTTSGIPIRGVTRITVEDDMEGGRAVMIRMRGGEVEFPPPPED
jgi:hypothetical protein